jgi:hypothetical protein
MLTFSNFPKVQRPVQQTNHHLFAILTKRSTYNITTSFSVSQLMDKIAIKKQNPTFFPLPFLSILLLARVQIDAKDALCRPKNKTQPQDRKEKT